MVTRDWHCEYGTKSNKRGKKESTAEREYEGGLFLRVLPPKYYINDRRH